MTATHTQAQLRNNPYKVAIASMVGTAIEFYDYYIYAAAAVLVFNTQFFDKSDHNVAILLSLSTLALAFFARPIGSALFGHFGDKIGRKKTLVASLLTMGLSTVCTAFIVCLPPRARFGLGRRMGRRGFGCHRKRARRQTRMVRHVPAAGRANWLVYGKRHVLHHQRAGGA